MVMLHGKKKILRFVDVLVRAPECILLMHSTTRLVKVGYEGATQDASDVYCICRCCGSLGSGPREWVRLDVSLMAASPTSGVQSLRVTIRPAVV